jgi:flagellar L-ring protein precursor FlgH
MNSFVLAVALVLLAGGEGHAQQHSSEDRSERVVRHTWITDRREYSEGDIITVLVDEATLASTLSDNTATRDHSQRLGARAGALSSTAGGRQIEADANSSSAAASRERGEATRRESFTTDITARVIEVAPNGLMQIEGRKALKIDAHEQVIELKGWVRPADISAGNLIESWRVANMEVTYKSNGELAKPRQSLFFRILGWLWP